MPFDWSLVTAPFRMQPGLRRVADGTAQLTPSRLGCRHLREKMAVLARFADEALVALPGFDPLPALRTVAAEAARHPPAAFALDEPGDGPLHWRAPVIGWSIDAGEPHQAEDGLLASDSDRAIGELLWALPAALRPAALLCLAFEDDFAVIDGASATIPWLAVCLPSRWAPGSKVGRHFVDVHAPVADNARLLAAGAPLTRFVTGGERWERFVWTVSPDPHLHQHPARGEAPWPEEDSDGRFADATFRSERQTFIPVPGASQAVFTIHVETLPMHRAVAVPGAAARLHAAIASMSHAVLVYRGLDAVREPLLRWLQGRADEVKADEAPPDARCR